MNTSRKLPPTTHSEQPICAAIGKNAVCRQASNLQPGSAKRDASADHDPHRRASASVVLATAPRNSPAYVVAIADQLPLVEIFREIYVYCPDGAAKRTEVTDSELSGALNAASLRASTAF